MNHYPFVNRYAAILFVCVTAVTACFLLATSPMLPLTWDEGESIDRAASLLRGETWRHIVESEGHPSGYAWVIAAGRCVAPKFLGEKTRWRFGPILLAAIACGLVTARGAVTISPLFGVAAVALLLTTPRLFAHLHIAACDAPLSAMWLVAIAIFDVRFASWLRTILFGLVLGLTLSMKFSGWLAPIPFLVFACVLMWREPRRRGVVFVHTLLAMLIAACVFVALHTTLWPDPFGGFATFITRNVTREGLNIPALFFGRLYNLDHPLPVYNTLVWAAITLPLGHVVLTVLGVVFVIFPPKRLSLTPESTDWLRLVGASAVVPLVARAIPGTPVHDAERLFLPAFASLAILAAFGVCFVWQKRVVARLVVVFVALIGVANLVGYAPQWLSFYGGAIGGLRGAVACGFEPTYWWDGLDRDASDWLAANTPEGGLVVLSATSTKTLALQQRWGELPQTIRVSRVQRNRSKELPQCVWYVLQHRASAMEPTDIALTQNAKPRWSKTIHGVALIEIYAGE